jgi:hypothetical protein
LRQGFAVHRQSCPNCGPLYADVQEGMQLLNGLEEVEPPRHLMHNILAITSGAHPESEATAGKQARAGWQTRFRAQLMPALAGVLRSRFAASFCMAFFSLSLTLSLIGVRVTDVAYMAAHPSELRKTVVLEYSRLQARVMSYYDNMRLVYEVQNRVRELQKAAAPAATEDKGPAQPDQQNLIQPAPGAPSFKEVVQPQVENAENVHDGKRLDRATLRIRLVYRTQRLPDLKRLSALEVGEFMKKSEGAQI